MNTEDIIKRYPTHHVELQFYPTGGTVYLWACKECGSEGAYDKLWGVNNSCKTLEEALDKLDKEIAEDES